MKLSITINLGNYESMKIESGERDSIDGCLSEIRAASIRINTKQVYSFCNRHGISI